MDKFKRSMQSLELTLLQSLDCAGQGLGDSDGMKMGVDAIASKLTVLPGAANAIGEDMELCGRQLGA